MFHVFYLDLFSIAVPSANDEKITVQSSSLFFMFLSVSQTFAELTALVWYCRIYEWNFKLWESFNLELELATQFLIYFI